MSEKPANTGNLQNSVKEDEALDLDLGVVLFPIAHNEFQARWSLSEKTLASGIKSAAEFPEDVRLILRVFSLPNHSAQSDFSNYWRDYNIEGRINIAHFIFDAPAEKITAAIGLINRNGRFSPLARAGAINLPLTPAPPAKVPTGPFIPASGGSIPSSRKSWPENG